MQSYYELFYKQEMVQVSSGFPPPWQYDWIMGDGAEVYGVYIRDDSTEMRIAGGQGLRTVGRFACSPSVPIESGITLRRVSDNNFYRITGDPKASGTPATWQSIFAGELSIWKRARFI